MIAAKHAAAHQNRLDVGQSGKTVCALCMADYMLCLRAHTQLLRTAVGGGKKSILKEVENIIMPATWARTLRV